MRKIYFLASGQFQITCNICMGNNVSLPREFLEWVAQPRLGENKKHPGGKKLSNSKTENN